MSSRRTAASTPRPRLAAGGRAGRVPGERLVPRRRDLPRRLSRARRGDPRRARCPPRTSQAAPRRRPGYGCAPISQRAAGHDHCANAALLRWRDVALTAPVALVGVRARRRVGAVRGRSRRRARVRRLPARAQDLSSRQRLNRTESATAGRSAWRPLRPVVVRRCNAGLRGDPCFRPCSVTCGYNKNRPDVPRPPDTRPPPVVRAARRRSAARRRRPTARATRRWAARRRRAARRPGRARGGPAAEPAAQDSFRARGGVDPTERPRARVQPPQPGAVVHPRRVVRLLRAARGRLRRAGPADRGRRSLRRASKASACRRSRSPPSRPSIPTWRARSS